MGRKRKKRRQSHGCAWHWAQTDCWYYTMPGTRKRVPLFDDDGQRIRGGGNKEAAEIALAKARLTWSDGARGLDDSGGPWLVARVCSDYIQYCERGLAKGSISKSHRDNSVRWLNDLCSFCGALPVSELKRGHVTEWIDGHDTWQSSETRRGVIAVVLAAFNRAQDMFGVPNPIKGLKKPKPQPRLALFTPEEEKALYGATDEHFGAFLFAAIHTGLRPFCELAKLTADDVEEAERGMMWRVYSSKTEKTRKIPVRPEVAELTRKLLKRAPRDSRQPLFLNSKERPWKSSAGVVRFIKLRQKLDWEDDPVRGKYSCYTCRHTFAHRMLSGFWTDGVGCSIETLAELIGDTPKVAFDHYGREWGQHYQEPLWNAIGEGEGAPNRRRPATPTAVAGDKTGKKKSRRRRKQPARR